MFRRKGVVAPDNSDHPTGMMAIQGAIKLNSKNT
jgi:hypothetical protein